jgi:DNA polymerase III subunit beta
LKISVAALPFREALENLFTIAHKKSPKPILQNVLLVARPDEVELSATSLDVGVRLRLTGIHVEEPGAALLPPRVLQVVKLTDAAEVRILADPETVRVEEGRNRYKLPADNPEHFPAVPEFPADRPYHLLAGADLKRLIRRTYFATDAESTRYALGGTAIEYADGRLSLIGTDGRRLAWATAPCQAIDGGADASGSPVIPLAALKLLLRLLGEDEARIAINPKNDVLIRSGGATLYCRLCEGRFPRWRDTIPAGRTATATATVGPLLQALGQASIATSADSRGVDFTFRDGTLTLEGHAPDVGEGRVIIPVGYDHPEPIAVTLVPDLLADALRALDPELEVTLSLTDAKGPVVLRADADSFTFAVMPLTRES